MLDLAMYTLPRDLDGAGEMAHGRDEVMIVVRGGSRLDLGTDGINVGDGSIVFVEAGVTHRFRLISDDLEILLIREP
jgi:mannose-6-phosphate isomerase-like protein (cupin superfamily)